MAWSELMLTMTPSWETAYRGPADARYAAWGGMYFEVHRSAVTGWLFVDRIDSVGRYLGECAAATSDDQVKALVRTWLGRPPEVPEAAFDGPHLNTVRKRAQAARTRERKQAWRDANPEAAKAAKERELAERRARAAGRRQSQQGRAA